MLKIFSLVLFVSLVYANQECYVLDSEGRFTKDTVTCPDSYCHDQLIDCIGNRNHRVFATYNPSPSSCYILNGTEYVRSTNCINSACREYLSICQRTKAPVYNCTTFPFIQNFVHNNDNSVVHTRYVNTFDYTLFSTSPFSLYLIEAGDAKLRRAAYDSVKKLYSYKVPSSFPSRWSDTVGGLFVNEDNVCVNFVKE